MTNSTKDQIKVIYKTHPKSKSISIKIKNDLTVIVNRPVYIRQTKAEAFFNEHKEAILKHIKAHESPSFELNCYYKSKFNLFMIKESSGKNSQQKLDNKTIIKISRSEQGLSLENQDFINNSIESILKSEAKQYLPKRVFELAQMHSLDYNNIKINKAKSRWGSCNIHNDLNFSCYIMLLPFELIDYIILHELSHTIHKNHSQDFYHLLDQLSNNQHHTLNKSLKQFSLKITPKYFEKL
jgi:predicted metal-dependent hydrolase